MVRTLAYHHAVLARDGSGNLGRQIVCFRPRADEPARAEVLREFSPQAFRQLDDLLVQVPRVRVEQAGLGRDGFHNTRVAMPHRGDVVVAIEVTAPFGVEEPDPLTSYEMDGLVVEELVGGSEGPTSTLQEFVLGHGSHSYLHRGSRVGAASGARDSTCKPGALERTIQSLRSSLRGFALVEKKRSRRHRIWSHWRSIPDSVVYIDGTESPTF